MAKGKMPPQLLEYFKNKNAKKDDGTDKDDKEKRKDALDAAKAKRASKAAKHFKDKNKK